MAGDPLRTRLCSDYGCEYPIVGLSLERQVVVAISEAGGIGVLAPAPEHGPGQIREDVRWIRERLDGRPFGVDLVLPASYVSGEAADLEAQVPQGHRDFVERLQREHEIPDPRTPDRLGLARADLVRRAPARIDAVLDEQVPIFVSGLGSPAAILDRAHAQGTKVWSLIGATRQARRVIEDGVDLVAATGSDGAAHVGRVGTFSLVPEVVTIAGGTPVLAAGGVSSGRQLLAALALGAVGVWTGTIWQATEESTVDPYLKQQLMEATADRVVLTRARTGKPFNQLRSRWTEAWEQPDAPEPLRMPLQQVLVGKILQAIEDWRIEDFMSLPAGQGVGGIESVRPVRQVIDDIVADARAAYAALEEPPTTH